MCVGWAWCHISVGNDLNNPSLCFVIEFKNWTAFALRERETINGADAGFVFSSITTGCFFCPSLLHCCFIAMCFHLVDHILQMYRSTYFICHCRCHSVNKKTRATCVLFRDSFNLTHNSIKLKPLPSWDLCLYFICNLQDACFAFVTLHPSLFLQIPSQSSLFFSHSVLNTPPCFSSRSSVFFLPLLPLQHPVSSISLPPVHISILFSPSRSTQRSCSCLFHWFEATGV